jgi:hypothetical protein
MEELRVLDTDKAVQLAKKYEYWQVKTDGEIVARKSKEIGKGENKKVVETEDDLQQTLNDIESDGVFSFAQVDIGSSQSSCRVHIYVVFNKPAFEKWTKNRGLGNANTSQADKPKKEESSKVSTLEYKEFMQDKRMFEQQRIEEARASNAQLRADIFAEMKREQERHEAELRISKLEIKLEADYQNMMTRLETDFKLKMNEFENACKIDEMKQEQAWKEIEEAEKDIAKRERILARKKEKITEAQEGSKKVVELISENLGSATKSFFSGAIGLDGVFGESTKKESLEGAETAKETTEKKPKRDFSSGIK